MMSPIIGIVSEVALVWTMSMLLMFTTAQQPQGFLSIDCGSTTQYKDSATNLTWEKDDSYIFTGMNAEVPHPPDSSVDNYQALRTFKYFPNRRNKYCFELPVKTNISVLIRATFLHGDSSELELPITFDVYLDSTWWITVQYDFDSDLHSPTVVEGIFYSPGTIVYFCLVPDKGIPFISSLELRQLDPEDVMYSPNDRKGLFLSNLCRYNLGAPDSLRTVRYPNDAYDRFWTSLDSSKLDIGDDISSQEVYPNTTLAFNNVPPEVMMTAIYLGDSAGLYAKIPVNLTTSSGYLYATFYCEALVDNSSWAPDISAYRDMSILLNHDQTDPFNVSGVPVLKTFKHFSTGIDHITVGLNSDSTAILNAFEIYEERIIDPVTSNDQAEFLANLKEILNLTDWQGDPCFPVFDDWVECESDDFGNSWRIVNLILSEVHNTANLQTLVGSQSFGVILNGLSLTYSDVNDATFQFLVENVASYTNNLNFTSNRITTISKDLQFYSNSIDLSHNLLTGEVPTSSNMSFLESTYLNFSYNAITSISSFWENSSTGPGLFNLTVMDISHNSMSTSISSGSITRMLQRSPQLKELHMSDNFLAGTFPSDFYFSKENLPSLKLLNLDRNNITGVLDLNPWFNILEQTSAKYNQSIVDRLYSFVENDITAVTPNVDDYEHTIKLFMDAFPQNQNGILLGRNPYCKNARSFTKRYLCRSSADEIVLPDNGKGAKSTTGLIVGIIIAIVCVIILAFVSLMLWRKLSSSSKLLQEVQQELSDRRVQPPFFSYRDLKVATKNFHEDTKLGSGAFGAVYKGVLPDGTTVAVKRLFNSEKEAVLSDFLNEVVLITGIKHRNLVQLKGCCINKKDRILVYEFAKNGNLAQALWGKTSAGKSVSQKLSWGERVHVAIGVARGLSYLHEELQPRIIHRDIKAANVLLNETLVPKIADFGLARLFEDEETQAQFTAVAGTRGYWAPEYVLEGNLTTKADVYSFGILLLEIATGKMCIDVTRPVDCIYLKNWVEDLQKEGTLVEILPPDLRVNFPNQEFSRMVEIALLCTRLDPKMRPPMSQVVIMLFENMAVSMDWTVASSYSRDIESDSNPLSRSQSGFPDSEEAPLVSSTWLSGINFSRSVVLQEDRPSRLHDEFRNSEEIPFRKWQSFPGNPHTEQ